MSSTSSKIIALWSGLCLVLLAVCLHSPSAEGVRACGKHLNTILSLVCGNSFGTRVRRSLDPLDIGNDLDGEEDTALGLESWPFLTDMESNSLTKTRRRRLGVVHECCMKACSLSELKSYCRPATH